MKESKYNFIWPLDNEEMFIVFNSLSGCLVKADKKFQSYLIGNEVIQDDEKIYSDMIHHGFLIEDDVDETKILQFKHFHKKFNTENLSLTIAPTLNCNFNCFYCYENHDDSIMTNEISDCIVEFVNNSAKKLTKLSINWFGGEPLLYPQLIEQLSLKLINICEKNDIKYNGGIITNGSLLNTDLITMLQKSRINKIQITVDGPPIIHNERRTYKSSNQGSFEVIINNLKSLQERGFHLSLRVNIDKTNVNYSGLLLDILLERGLDKIDLSLGKVTPYTNACKNITQFCLENIDFAYADLDFHILCKQKGFTDSALRYHPKPRVSYCSADHINSFVIDPNGNLYKCWNDIGDVKKSIGHIKFIGKKIHTKNFPKFVEWVLWNPFENEECIRCKILPLCMGGCPSIAKRNNENHSCEKWKYNLEEVIRFNYSQR